MKPERWTQLRELYLAALEHAPAERAAFLEQACASDPTLRGEVESLLACEPQAGSFLEQPAFDFGALALEQPTQQTPLEQIGHYQIIQRIGAGGMGEVYLTQDTRLGRKVALKLLPARFTNDRERVRRFEQEARAASALNHPNILTIYEIGQASTEAGELHFIATEFIDGQTLRQRLQAGPLKVLEALDLLLQAASALAAAHEAGIVHRDIKPENIMLRRDGYLKVLDFGLAKLTEHQKSALATLVTAGETFKTEPGMVMGTLAYMSPEQARGLTVDGRTDIFSLGVVSYELLSGQRPFSGTTGAEVVAALLHLEPPSLQRVVPELPAALAEIIGKMLRKEREQRYQTAAELLANLKALKQRLEIQAELARPSQETRVGTSEAVTALQTAAQPQADTAAGTVTHTTSSAEYLISEFKRHRLGVLLALAAFVLLIAGSAYWLAQRIGRPASQPAMPFQTMKLAQLTFTGKVSTAAISPDGKYVAYVLEDGGRSSLWLRQVELASQQQIAPPAEQEYQELLFSRDGKWLYYIVQDESNPVVVLYQIPVLGGAPRRLLTNANPIGLSPDGRQVAFVRDNTGPDEDGLLVTNADGSGEARKLSARKYPDFFVNTTAPAWSPDGKFIACGIANAAERHATVGILPATGGEARPLTKQHWTATYSLAWLDDGSGLIVAAPDPDAGPKGQLWHLAYPSGELSRVINDLNSYVSVSLTADARALITVQMKPSLNFWLLPKGETRRATQITFDTGKGEGMAGFAWTPDGKLVYTSLVSGQPDLWIMESDGSHQQQLTFNAGNNTYPIVSPDGRAIVFASTRTGAQRVWRMDTSGGNAKQLTNDSPSYPYLGVTEQWLVYGRALAGKFTLWKVPLEGGEPAPLSDEFAVCPAVSPDGKLIAYFSGAGLGKIYVMPFAGGAPLKTFNQPAAMRWGWLRWTPDSRALSYLVTRGGVSNIWNLPLDGTPPQPVTNFKTEQIYWFDWSRDGRLALTRGVVNRDVVLITNLK